MRAAVFFVMLSAAAAQPAEPPPAFLASAVTAPNLAPGAILSIYGNHLGPASTCLAPAGPNQRETVNPRNPDPQFANLSVFPRELCGVQVTIDGAPAGMIYVSPGQINFKVPQDSPEQGAAELRVIYHAQSSAPVSLPAGWGTTTIALAEPAFANMPVWLKVSLPFGRGRVSYPSSLGPAGFGCNQVEVRRDGVLLPQREGANWSKYLHTSSGPPCGGSLAPAKPFAEIDQRLLDRLPLHLLYDFAAPGAYEVRYTLRELRAGGRFLAQSDWTPIEILPSRPSQAQALLGELLKNAPTDPGELVLDYLPNLLSFPGDASFEMVASYLYNASPNVRRYAAGALFYWPEDSTSAKLLALLHSKGPSDELVRFLLQQPQFGPAHQSEVIAASLPYLKRNDVVAFEGALTSLRWPPAATDPAAFTALLDAAESMFPRVEVPYRNNIIEILTGPSSAPLRDRRVHALLWKLADDGYALEAASGIAAFQDPADLPRLTALMSSSPAKDRLSFLPHDINANFGAASVPYLETALRARPGRFTERALAHELMAAGDAGGFRYALETMASSVFDRSDMRQRLRSQFSELKDASDDAIAAFLRARAGN